MSFLVKLAFHWEETDNKSNHMLSRMLLVVLDRFHGKKIESKKG
jgi:hypothetical protein